jgi:hypothetical protein
LEKSAARSRMILIAVAALVVAAVAVGMWAARG